MKRWMWIAAVLALAVAPLALRGPDRLAAPGPLVLPPPVVALADGVRVSIVSGDAAPGTDTLLPWAAEGRVLRDPGGGPGLWHEWPGISLHAAFAGDALRIGLDDPENRFRLSVDGRAVAGITRPGLAVAQVAGLGGGPHRLRIDRLSEAAAPHRIAWIGVPAAGMALPPPVLPDRRIDIYGDSDTVGYGNTRGGRSCSGDDGFLATDTTQAYPARVARRYGAAVAVMARSGVGLVRGYGGDGDGMATLFDRLLPSRPGPRVAGEAPAWLTIVEVGANDFAQPLRPGEPWPDKDALARDFGAAMEGFLRGILQRSPGAPVILLGVPDPGQGLRPEIAAAAAGLQAEGAPVTLVRVTGLDHRGCDWHPSLADHAMIETAVAAEIDRLMASGALEKR